MLDDPDTFPPEPNVRPWIKLVALALALLFVGGLVWGVVTNAPQIVKAFLPRMSEEEVRQTITTAITAERAEAFLVTGSLDVQATIRQASRQVFLPGLLNLDLGTSTATVRVPGTAVYGFDVRTLRPGDIRLADDGVVEVTIPALAVKSVEADLARMEVETARGWLRSDASVARMQDTAVRQINVALRNQAIAYVSGDAVQAKTNTATALAAMLRPALVAAGMEAPRFRFQITPTLRVDG